MKISIITATYNSGATLRDTINSVFAQSYFNYEMLIIDGGSTDNTEDIVKEYIPKFEGRLKWYSGKDNGLYDAMNKGVEKAMGDVIGILNSDDFYANGNVLKTIVDAIENVDAVYGDLVFVNPENTEVIVRQWKGSQYTPGAFMKGWHPAHPTFYARKELFEKFGSFDINFDVSADFELMFRFLEKGQAKSRYIPHTFVKMRLGGESTGSIRKIIQGNKNVLKAFKKNGYKAPPLYLFRRLAPKVINLIKNKLHI